MSDVRKRQGKNGTTYQVRYINPNTKSGYAYKSFPTRKQAIAYREDAAARQSGSSHHTTIKTVVQATDKWLDICEKEGLNGREPVTAYTLKNYIYRVDIIKSYNWPKPIHELTPPDIVEFRSSLLKGSYSRDVVGKVLTTLQSIFKEMTIRGILTTNVAQGINIQRNSRYDEDVTIPSKLEIKELLAAADRLIHSPNKQIAIAWQRYRPILYLAVDSGMRPQEYLALSVNSLRENGVYIDRAIEGSGNEISVPKTAAGRRFIELSSTTVSLLNEYIQKHHVGNEYDLIFSTSTGKWIPRRQWRDRGFNVACFEAGLYKTEMLDGKNKKKPLYTPYDLRHFFASIRIAQNTNLKKLQKMMGHSKIETTFNVYGHLIEDHEQDNGKSNGVLDFV